MAYNAKSINMPLLEGPQGLCRLLTPPCKGNLVPKRDNLGVELCGVRSLTTRGGAALLLGDRLGASAFRLGLAGKTQWEKSLLAWLGLSCGTKTRKISIYRTQDWSPESRIFKSHRFNPYGCITHVCPKFSRALLAAVSMCS